MAEIRIDSYGHSCFKVTYGKDSALFDPYENNNVPGLKLPADLEASRIYCSHEHGDHNAKHLIRETDPEGDPFHAEFLIVPHDEAGGALRGMNRITILQAGSCKVIHMGDIGRLPLEEEYALMKGADVLMIPVGGHFTIDALQARTIVKEIAPKLTILMHYRKGERGYGVIADIDTVKQTFSNVKESEDTSVCFDEADVPAMIMTLEPAQ